MFGLPGHPCKDRLQFKFRALFVHRPHRRFLKLLCFFLVYAASVVLFSGCATPPIESDPEDEEILPVETETLNKNTFIESMTLSGRSRSKQVFPVLSPAPTLIEHVFVQLGEEVSMGQPLLQLGSVPEGGQPVLGVDRERAQAMIDGAQTGAVTMLELQAARQVIDTEDPLEVTEGQTGQTILAPFDGVISLLNIHSGEMADENSLLLQLTNMDELVIDMQVGTSRIPRLQAGMKTLIHFDHLQEPLEARLDALSPSPAAEEHVYQAQVHINNEERNIYPGMPARVDVETRRVEDAILAPVEAVFFQDESAFVYVVREETAILQEVELDGRNPSYYHVVSGLNEGEKVITAGRERVTDGQQVRIQDPHGLLLDPSSTVQKKLVFAKDKQNSN